MEFSLTSGGYWQLGPLGKFSRDFILISIVFLIFASIGLIQKRFRLKKQMGWLMSPFLLQLTEGKWNPAELKWEESNDPRMNSVSKLLRPELIQGSLIKTIGTLQQTIGMLTGNFDRFTRILHIMGIGCLLFGSLGSYAELINYLRIIQETGSGLDSITCILIKHQEIYYIIIFGIIVGSICLWVASMRRGLVKVLQQEVSDQFLASAMKKN